MVRPPKKRVYNFEKRPERQTDHHQDASDQDTLQINSNVEDVNCQTPKKVDTSTEEGAMKNLKMSAEIDEMNADSSLQEDAIAGENQTLTPTKSRFGRSHKPKMLGDFVSTDKKVSIVLKVSPVNQFKYYKESSRNRDLNRTRSPRLGRPPKKSLLRDSLGSQKSSPVSDPQKSVPALEVPVPASPSVDINVKVEPEELEPDPGCEWMVGDLAWARVGNHPFWPCIIARDPELGIFTRIRMFFKSLVPHRRLHVQFFGDNGRRSWLSSTSVMNYTGRAAFEELSQMILSGMKRKDPKQVSALVVKPNLKPVWESAVNEAESLLNSSREERVLHFKRLMQKNAPSQKVSEINGEENSHPPLQRVKRQYRKRKAETSQGDLDYEVANKQIKLDNEGEASKVPSPRKRGRPRKSLDPPDKDVRSKQEPTEFSPATKSSKLLKIVVKMKVDERNLSENLQTESESAQSLPDKSVDEQLESEDRPKKKFRTPNAKSSEQMTKSRNKKAKMAAEFNNFSSQQFSKISSEHPEMGPKEVEIRLERMWKDLDDAKKSKYRIKLNCKDKDDDEEEESVTWDLEDTDEKTSTSEISESPLTLPVPKSRNKVSIFNGAFQGKVCQVCEKPGNTFRCKGPCFGTYHLECAANPRDFSARINEIFQSVNASSPGTVVKKKKQDGRRKKSGVLNKTESEDSVVSTEVESEVDPGEALVVRNSEVKEDIDEGEATVGEEEAEEVSKVEEGTKVEEVSKVEESNDCGDASEVKTDKKKAAAGRGKKEGGSKEKEKEKEKELCDSSEEADSQSADFRCAACSEGRLQACFVCGREEFNGENSRQRCHVAYCGRVYHLECLKAWPQVNWLRSAGSIRGGGGNGNGRRSEESKGKQLFACPQHACHTCISDNPKVMKERFANDRLVKCLRCPTSYHYGNHCLPAGTEIIAARQIICPQHYKKHKKGLQHVNAAWCFICASGGSLICCDMCPTAFHADCLKISPPEGGYICEDCETGRFPLYGEIVWVKLGVYRWWPAQIMFPHQIPENIRNLVHARGEFAVKFFGSHDFYWVNRGRVFLYQEGDSGGRCGSKRKATDQMFLRAVTEASEACMRLKNEKASREATHRSGMKPPSYIRIKTNKPVGQVRAMEANISSLTPCECDPNSANPCALDTDCLNRILMIECNPLICPAGQRCKNQQFEKREYPPLMPYRTDGRGWGLKTLVDLKKGEFVIEYVGEMINEVEYQRRLQKMHEANENNYYFLTIDKDRMLDAGPKGNVARFMNHSCQPNCETQKWTVNGDTRVGLFALHDIPAETELVFNYNLESIGTDKKPCMCGAPNCSGFIGVKASKNGNGNHGDDSVVEKPKKPRRRSRSTKLPAKLSDEFCFICEKGGELLLCDGKTCNKAYHLTCLSRNKKHPVGHWLCPWHQCNVCCRGKVFRCNFCINSYCPTHAEGNIHLEESIGYVCSKHGSKKGDKNKTDDKSKAAIAESTVSPKDEESTSLENKDKPVAEVVGSPSQGISELDSSSPSPDLVPSEKQNNNVDSGVLNVKALSCSPRTRRSRSNSDVNQTAAESGVKLLRRIRRPASVDSVLVGREVEVPLKETLLRNTVLKRRSLKATSPEEKSGTDGDSIPCTDSETSKENTEPKETAKIDQCSSSINLNGDCKEENVENDSLKNKEPDISSPSDSTIKTDEKESGEVVESSCKVDEEKKVTSNHNEEVLSTDESVLDITKTEEKNEGSTSKSSHTPDTNSEENSDKCKAVRSEDCEPVKVNDEAMEGIQCEKLPSSAENADDKKDEATENSKSDVKLSSDVCDLHMEVVDETPNDEKKSFDEGSTKDESFNEGIANVKASVTEEKSVTEASGIETSVTEEVKVNGLAEESSETPPSPKHVETNVEENNKTSVLEKNSSDSVIKRETRKKLVEDHCKTRLNPIVDCNSETNGKVEIPGSNDVCVKKKSANSKKQILSEDKDSLLT